MCAKATMVVRVVRRDFYVIDQIRIELRYPFSSDISLETRV